MSLKYYAVFQDGEVKQMFGRIDSEGKLDGEYINFCTWKKWKQIEDRLIKSITTEEEFNHLIHSAYVKPVLTREQRFTISRMTELAKERGRPEVLAFIKDAVKRGLELEYVEAFYYFGPAIRTISKDFKSVVECKHIWIQERGHFLYHPKQSMGPMRDKIVYHYSAMYEMAKAKQKNEVRKFMRDMSKSGKQPRIYYGLNGWAGPAVETSDPKFVIIHTRVQVITESVDGLNFVVHPVEKLFHWTNGHLAQSFE